MSFDPSSWAQPIIPYRVCLKWLLLLFSLFNSDDEIREIPSRWDFHCACVDSVPLFFHTNSTSTYFLSDPFEHGAAWAGRARGRQEVLWCRSEPAGGKYGQIWSVLSIMSRWNGLDQITNLELITKVVAGLCFIPSPTLLSPLSGDSCRHLSAFLRGVLPSLLSTTLDVLLIPFHRITPCLWARAH